MKTAAAAAALLGARVVSADVTAADRLNSGMPFKEPMALHSSGGSLYVEFDYVACPYEGPLTSFVTRCYAYNGEPMLPGPSLYVYPGDTLTIKLTNKLSDADSVSYHNFWQYLNKTNLHFHGGHVTANQPGDDVLTMIEPMQADCLTDDCPANSITYVYEIPEYHMPGTAWYHPHGHGSATLQTGTGSSGFIIIMDHGDSVPSYVSDAPEMVLNIDHFNLLEMANWGTQSCVSTNMFMPTACGSEGCWPTGTEVGKAGIILVNAMTNPVLTATAGVWYRQRFLMASTLYMVNGVGGGDADTLAGCTFGLIAKDSIYLLEAPRDISRIFLYPGSRADVMMKCDVPGSVTFTSEAFPNQELVLHHVLNYVGDLFSITIEASSADAEPALPTFMAPRPCYVADTRSVLYDTDYVVQKPLVYDVCETGSGSHDTPGRRLTATALENEIMSTEEGRKLVAEATKKYFAADENQRQLAAAGADGVYVWEYDEYAGTSIYAEAFYAAGMISAPTCMALADEIFQAKAGLYCLNGCSFEVGVRNPVTNLVDISDEIHDYIGTACKIVNDDAVVQVGDIIEWDTWGIDYHPVHFHVNPYQIAAIHFEDGTQGAGSEATGLGVNATEAEFAAFSGGFYATGDFGDCVMLPVTHATLHQQVDNFATVMVQHCHILLHEDIGMMMGLLIAGTSGTHTRAQEIDPTCYWNLDEMGSYTISSTCDSDRDCPTGWSCGNRRGRKLAFGHASAVCEQD